MRPYVIALVCMSLVMLLITLIFTSVDVPVVTKADRAPISGVAIDTADILGITKGVSSALWKRPVDIDVFAIPGVYHSARVDYLAGTFEQLPLRYDALDGIPATAIITPSSTFGFPDFAFKLH